MPEKILVVDDDAVVRRELAKDLEAAGYKAYPDLDVASVDVHLRMGICPNEVVFHTSAQ